MSTVKLVSDAKASKAVRAVFDDIRKTRKTDFINNFWRALAVHPPTLKRTWESVKEVMQPGALDPLVKEMLYIAVSATNGCEYCVRSHTAAAFAKGMSQEQYGELLAVIGMANETNRLVGALQVPVDKVFQAPK